MKWIENNAVGLGVLLAFIPVVWNATFYLIDLSQEQRANNFVKYHEAIMKINTGSYKASSQRAQIYELGNFPEYKEFTCRESSRLKKQFKDSLSYIEELDELRKKLKCKINT